MSQLKVDMPLKDLAIWLGKYVGVTLTHMAKIEEYAAHALAKTAHSVRGQPVFRSENISEFFQLQPQTPLAFFGLRLPQSSRDTLEYLLFQSPSSSPQHYCTLPPLQPLI